jgi:hypothetical protein
MSARAIVIACSVLSSACVEPFYNRDIGVEGVATPEGSLEGTFALVTQLSDEAETPLGDQTGGGQSYYLAKRTHDGGGAYTVSLDPCRVVNFEVAGLSSSLSDDTTRAIPKVTVQVTVDHASGAITSDSYREVWGVEGLSAKDALPDSAGDDRIFDMEDDGHPGATLRTSGLVNGELYFVQRKIVSLEGVVTGEDTTLGLADHKKESFVIDATDDLLKSATERHQHPDPKESWFHEVRLSDSADCGDVRDAADDQNLHLRPF